MVMNETESKINVPELLHELADETRRLLQTDSEIRGTAPEELAVQILDQHYGKELPKKERFLEGKRHFSIPKSSFILFAIPRHEWQMLRKWQDHKDEVIIAPAGDSEVFLLNKQQLARHEARKQKKQGLFG
jgi:hypothetical protein